MTLTINKSIVYGRIEEAPEFVDHGGFALTTFVLVTADKLAPLGSGEEHENPDYQRVEAPYELAKRAHEELRLGDMVYVEGILRGDRVVNEGDQSFDYVMFLQATDFKVGARAAESAKVELLVADSDVVPDAVTNVLNSAAEDAVVIEDAVVVEATKPASDSAPVQQQVVKTTPAAEVPQEKTGQSAASRAIAAARGRQAPVETKSAAAVPAKTRSTPTASPASSPAPTPTRVAAAPATDSKPVSDGAPPKDKPWLARGAAALRNTA